MTFTIRVNEISLAKKSLNFLECLHFENSLLKHFKLRIECGHLHLDMVMSRYNIFGDLVEKKTWGCSHLSTKALNFVEEGINILTGFHLNTVALINWLDKAKTKREWCEAFIYTYSIFLRLSSHSLMLSVNRSSNGILSRLRSTKCSWSSLPSSFMTFQSLSLWMVSLYRSMSSDLLGG